MTRIPGPVPMANPVKTGGNDKTLGLFVLHRDDVVRGPELPKDRDWHWRTIEWYESWRRSPMAQIMEPSDWDIMLGAAILHHELWSKQQFLKASEIAQLSKEFDRKVSQFGATYADRLRLRIRIADDSETAALDDEDELDDEFGYGDLLAD